MRPSSIEQRQGIFFRFIEQLIGRVIELIEDAIPYCLGALDAERSGRTDEFGEHLLERS